MQLYRGVLDGTKSATTCTMSLHVAYEIILADFNLAVSTLTAKSQNIIPHQIFWLYGNNTVIRTLSSTRVQTMTYCCIVISLSNSKVQRSWPRKLKLSCSLQTPDETKMKVN